jgi:hypothetical protein
MTVTSISITPDYIKRAGKGYAFLGGFIDLEPWNETYYCVGQDVDIAFDQVIPGGVVHSGCRLRLGRNDATDELIAAARDLEERARNHAMHEFDGLGDAVAEAVGTMSAEGG